MIESQTRNESTSESEPRRPCPKPADIRAEVAAYDQNAEVRRWDGPRYRMTYRVLGQGPPLVLIPGIAATYRGYAMTLNRLAERFQTVVYDYPGEHPDDGARLRAIRHEHLVDDLFGLIDHLNWESVFLVGISFGSTITFRGLHRDPRRFPRAVVQGAFAQRRFTPAERLALATGQLFHGQVGRLPLHEQVLIWNNKSSFPAILEDRWSYYLEQNACTPIASMAHRLRMLSQLDLRPILPEIPTEILVLQGKEDRIVPLRYHDKVCAALPHARSVLMPMVGHQPHYTHPEALAQAIEQFLLPCPEQSCTPDQCALLAAGKECESGTRAAEGVPNHEDQHT